MRAILAVVALLLAGPAVACGDDEEALSKAEYIRRGNELCRRLQRQAGQVSEKHFADVGQNEQPSEEQIRAYVDEAAPVAHDFADDLRDLGAPEGDEELLDVLVDDFDEAVDQLEAEPVESFSNQQALFADVNRRAGEYGLEACAGGQQQ